MNVIDRIHVIGQGQRDHIRFQTVNHRSSLFARTAMGLIGRHGITGFFG